ncbi:universal stress protein [Halorubrum vacuolatum]|uniref:Nucleotide-binding universal stress protein, UspA family n=1 Tax=Halorubrum vacuolatum TaxID=63740 RepID=A0A238URG2_HALVU|nr:universal stress protein [Halorubrum vacuolatum]SNR24551.1 Nucleotide-binding universal stress protein, UspA family [Halorubrum vacuolatum]
MGKRILVAVDGSDAAIEAARFAAAEWPAASVTLLHVINPAESSTGAEGGFPGAVEQWYESARARGERVLDRAAAALDRDVETRLEVGRPTRMILNVAHGSEPIESTGADTGDGTDTADAVGSGEDVPFDHVVLASRGRTGLSRVFLGSVAEGVVRRAEIPVTVVR